MSYIKIDSVKVIEACEKYLIKIEDWRIVRAKEIINKMALIRKWNFKPLGYDSALEILENNNAPMRFQIPFDVNMVNKLGKQERAENLLKLAKLGDPVMLSINDTFIFD